MKAERYIARPKTLNTAPQGNWRRSNTSAFHAASLNLTDGTNEKVSLAADFENTWRTASGVGTAFPETLTTDRTAPRVDPYPTRQIPTILPEFT